MQSRGLKSVVSLSGKPSLVWTAIEVRESLPDGTKFKAVLSYLGRSGVAKLVTVHFFDEV